MDCHDRLVLSKTAPSSHATVQQRFRSVLQVVRQAVAEKVFTKMPASVKPGVVTGRLVQFVIVWALSTHAFT